MRSHKAERKCFQYKLYDLDIIWMFVHVFIIVFIIFKNSIIHEENTVEISTISVILYM